MLYVAPTMVKEDGLVDMTEPDGEGDAFQVKWAFLSVMVTSKKWF